MTRPLGPMTLACALSAFLATATAPAVAQESLPRPKPIRNSRNNNTSNGRSSLHRMEILNGGTQAVRYFGEGLSPGESASVRELEGVENELLIARGLQALRQQYVSDERLLEQVRRNVQQQLYGVSATSTAYAGDSTTTFPSYGPNYYGGYYNVGYYPAGYAFPFASQVTAGGERTVNRSLANGVGDEGVLKAALAGVLARQSSPEYRADLERAYDRVASRAAASPALRVALGLPGVAEGRRERDRIRAASGEESGPVTLTLKGGEKLVGTRLQEGKDWYTLDTANGGQTRVRPAEVVRVDRTKAGRVVPASGGE